MWSMSIMYDLNVHLVKNRGDSVSQDKYAQIIDSLMFWQIVLILILHMLLVDWVETLIILVLSIGMQYLNYWDI